MARTPWTWYDPVSGLTQEFEINPSTFKATPFKKNVSTMKTCAGQNVFFEGYHNPIQVSMSGVVLEEDQYNTLQFLADTKSQIQITDDIGTVVWLHITELRFTRQLKRQYPWYHTFDIDTVVLDWG